MSIRPIGNRVLIKTPKAEEKTAGGIILTPSSLKSNPNIGEVIVVGNGEDVKILKAGDRIIHSEYTGTKVKDGNEEYTIIDFDSVLGIVE